MSINFNHLFRYCVSKLETFVFFLFFSKGFAMILKNTSIWISILVEKKKHIFDIQRKSINAIVVKKTLLSINDKSSIRWCCGRKRSLNMDSIARIQGLRFERFWREANIQSDGSWWFKTKVSVRRSKSIFDNFLKKIQRIRCTTVWWRTEFDVHSRQQFLILMTNWLSNDSWVLRMLKIKLHWCIELEKDNHQE